MHTPKKLRVFEAFAGIGSQTQALKNIGVEHEVVAIVENDKYAIDSYFKIHGEVLNLGDISKLDTKTIPDHDLFTYSFPCQDISVAGNQNGLDEGSGTRSGLLWECQKVIVEKKPKYLLLENVKNLVSEQHKHNFDKWLKWLENQGYTNYWQVLNARDYGIPQSRERVFVVSIMGEHEEFKFPGKQELKISLKDLVEDVVEEKYYLKEELQKKFEYLPPRTRVVDGITVLYPKEKNQITVKGNVEQPGWLRMMKAVVDTNGVSPTLTTCQGGYHEQKIMSHGKVRKLTPLEYWRLMGFEDEAFYKAESLNSNRQLYKQAGNTIVVNVLEAIFKELFK